VWRWATSTGDGNLDAIHFGGNRITQDVAVADVNQDGNPDVIAANVGKNQVFLGDGQGGFSGSFSFGGSTNSNAVAVISGGS
jgi:hypothetical protein